MIAHVAVILGHRDTGVDARLTGRDRHVGGVGDQGSALHDRLTAARIFQHRELLEHLRHLVAALAATDIDDHVDIRPLGQLMLRHGLARAEAARDGAGPATCGRKEKIDHALPRNHRHARRQPLGNRTRPPDRPLVQHAELTLAACRSHLGDHVGDRVVARLRNPGQRAADPPRYHDAMRDQLGLGHLAQHGECDNLTAGLLGRRERPLFLKVDTGRAQSALQEGPAVLVKLLQRTLDAVIDVAHDARAQPDRERLAARHHRLTRLEADRVLIDLDRRRVVFKCDNFPGQLLVADINLLTQSGHAHSAGKHHGAVDTQNY